MDVSFKQGIEMCAMSAWLCGRGKKGAAAFRLSVFVGGKPAFRVQGGAETGAVGHAQGEVVVAQRADGHVVDQKLGAEQLALPLQVGQG
ncbi:hypothetical protein [Acidovorax carolinensis]|uniref:hypothetical protein n=1 Tax=Acidovorax carolinensis TaxID=553814 RepID=UPI001F2F6F39|nr:hypothetical protein [Acidovorax carolinensis]